MSNGEWIIAEDGRPYYTEHDKKLALVGYVHAGEAEGSAEDALVDVLHRLGLADRIIAGTLMTVDEFGLDADTLSIHVDQMREWTMASNSHG